MFAASFPLLCLLLAQILNVHATPMVTLQRYPRSDNSILANATDHSLPFQCQATCLPSGNCLINGASDLSCCQLNNPAVASNCLNCLVAVGNMNEQNGQSTYNSYVSQCKQKGITVASATINGNTSGTSFSTGGSGSSASASGGSSSTSSSSGSSSSGSDSSDPNATGGKKNGAGHTRRLMGMGFGLGGVGAVAFILGSALYWGQDSWT